ncbi:MAG: PilZ domain-containing protein [Planctomycetota bacterium]|jgi:hypothetical protein
MERRRDYRHALQCALSLKCPQTRRVIGDLYTKEVSASGLSFDTAAPHGLTKGQRVEVQLVTPVGGETHEDSLVMATLGVVVRADERCAALHFETPLAY